MDAKRRRKQKPKNEEGRDEETSEKHTQKKKGRMKIRRRKQNSIRQSIYLSVYVSKDDQYVVILLWFFCTVLSLCFAHFHTHSNSCTSSTTSQPFSCRVSSQITSITHPPFCLPLPALPPYPAHELISQPPAIPPSHPPPKCILPNIHSFTRQTLSDRRRIGSGGGV